MVVILLDPNKVKSSVTDWRQRQRQDPVADLFKGKDRVEVRSNRQGGQ